MSEDLLFCAQLGRVDHIARLIAGGVDPDWRREDGVTTLMVAAMTGRVAVMEALLDAGAGIDLASPDGTTALLAACAYARTTREIGGIELLLARGADPNLANAEGNDGLMLCARHGLVEAVIILLKAGARTWRQNRHGTTALMQAARGHLRETVRVLLRAGCDLSQKDERGWGVLEYAHEIGPPPEDLRVLLSPRDLSSLDLAGRTSTFDKPAFKLTLLGSWNETADDTDAQSFLEVTGEREIQVAVQRLPATLEPDEQRDAIGQAVRTLSAALAREAQSPCRISDVRFLDAGETLQARFSLACPSLFAAICIYAGGDRFVTLTYRDHRPNLSDETRGRQAGESVASFRAKHLPRDDADLSPR